MQFTTKDGLPGDNIYSIVQDKDGFVWIATETGLSRFDGTDFRNFTVKDSLPGNEIISLFADHANRIWIYAFGYEPCYYYEGRIYTRRNSPLLGRLPERQELRSLAEDADNNLLIELSNTYVLIDSLNSCTFLPRPLKQLGFFKPLGGFHELSKEIISPEIIAPADTDNVSYTYNSYSKKSPSRCIFAAVGGQMLVYKPDGSVTRIPIPPGTHSKYPIADSIFVCNSENGSYVYDTRDGRLVSHFLRDYWVNITYFDDEGGIWVGTAGSGVFYYPAGGGISIRQTPANAPLQLRNLYPGETELIAGTNNGIFWKIDRKTHLPYQKLSSSALPSYVLHPPSGNIIRPPAPQLLKLAELAPLPPYISVPKSIFCSGDTFTIATYGFVIDVDKRTGRFRTIWDARATSALKWNHRYYIGTLKGLYCFPAGEPGPHDASNSLQLLGRNIGSIAFTSTPSLLWITTSDDGVYCIDSNNKTVGELREGKGLSGNICKCIFTDGRRVFVGTSNGLNVIDPARGFFARSYSTLDGLVSNDISCVYADGSNVWIGTPQGYTSIDLEQIRPDTAYCRLNMTGILVSGKPVKPGAGPMALGPDDNNIELRFAGISFRSMKQMKYYYRLNGLDSAWQQTTLHELHYALLPAGSYRLELYATNRYGARSRMYAIDFIVRARWWKTWWAQAGGIALLLGVVALALWLRHRQVRRREGEKAGLRAQIADLEQMALRAQMNPHFIFNSLNSFYQYVIHKDLAGASRFMGDFSMLLRLMFEITAEKEIALDKELLFLRTYLELERIKLRESFDYTVDVSEALPPAEDVRLPTFIIQPFVENCIRHGIGGLRDRRGHIAISFTRIGDDMAVSIADNGIGRSQSAAQKADRLSIQHSRGMALTGERIQLYNKSKGTNVRFEVSDALPSGTLVLIYFPLQPEP